MIDYGNPEAAETAAYQGAFLQLYLQAVTVGVLRGARNDAVALVRRRRRSFSHASTAVPAQDPQILRVIGEIAADAFAAEAIVLAAADKIQAAAESVVSGPDPAAAEAAQLAAAEAKVSIDSFSQRATGALFDVGGASAVQAAHNLDRNWRNVRTISAHNPASLKASAVGEYLVNGTPSPRNGCFLMPILRSDHS